MVVMTVFVFYSTMKLLWSFLLILSVLLLSNVSNGFDDDEDDDGVVEDIPDENIVREKVL